jgi:hypothetical protein
VDVVRSREFLVKTIGWFARQRARRAGETADRTREANVAFAGSLLETEIAQRNARKDAQENTGRGVIVTAGLVLTLLLGLANDAGVFSRGTSVVARAALVATMLLGAGAAACAIGALWPRKYDRLGREGLDQFNDSDFLDQPSHQVTGVVVATRIGIAKTMDAQHENKARWLKWSFVLLALAFVGLLAQGVVLALDPPAPKTTVPARIVVIDRR